jgi:multidrug efflux pump subunit AcrA (membrane-fusion protein)
VSNEHERSEELFDTLSKNKKLKKRKLLRTVISIIVVIALILIGVVIRLRNKVDDKFAITAANVLEYQVTTGTIHSLVSGSGTLAQVDLEALTVPAGVEIDEVIAERNDAVKVGDLLATVDMSTVMTALADVQAQLDALDEQIAAAKGDQVNSYISAGISGRVKQIFAEENMDVAACMAQHGALAVLSLDGYMALDLETDALTKGDAVTVIRADGSEIKGDVDMAGHGKATILVTDNGPTYGETVTVKTEDGTEIGSGELYIHSPLGITGYAGTVSMVNVAENTTVYSATTLFTLKNTSFTANYDTLLRQRGELEKELLRLLTIYRDGAILSPMDGVISSVEYGAEDSASALYAGLPSSLSGSLSGALPTTEAEEEAALLTIYPDISMSITIGIDEADILNLQIGQEVKVSVSSVSDETFLGTVTEINKDADISTGVTQYSAEVLIDKANGMLPGMTASVDITIEGVENAMIIPVDALHQTSATHFVYTGYNAETQEYMDMREVTIGMQNNDYVEILSGLNIGDTIYYTEKFDNFFDFAMGAMGRR